MDKEEAKIRAYLLRWAVAWKMAINGFTKPKTHKYIILLTKTNHETILKVFRLYENFAGFDNTHFGTATKKFYASSLFLDR